MSEPSKRDATGQNEELPVDWRLFLVDSRLKVVSATGPLSADDPSEVLGYDLADVLEVEGLPLADVGELLVCLEDMPTECELRLRLGEPAISIVARGFEESRGICCVVLRPKADPRSEKVLPAAWDWAVRSVRKMGLTKRDPSDAPLQILVVDQNPEVVEFGRTLARKLGCRSLGASSAGEALAQAKANCFDLVLVDHLIPGVGAQVLESLLIERGERDWGRAPLVAAMASDVTKLSGSGQIAIEKPISMGELGEVVQIAKRQRKETAEQGGASGGLPVLDIGAWKDDLPLLRRLSKALVAQGAELSLKLGESTVFSEKSQFLEDLKSLKNGADILRARRLSAICGEILDSVLLLGRKARVAKLDNLLIEIEGFRLFAAGQGLLRD
ncbi:response regulator [Pelagicoccus mobilis]|uniref:Response regulatory domain-containing protein n=1 Tax=Pelagicoccus mobilis TaxID=415221 RepID=A0A934VQI2_9BACT|nr:hypothetical protein [Pelagicoccus mobilis]MBK1876608.1 hypothetical protein [Pelagicoccus mobilis]